MTTLPLTRIVLYKHGVGYFEREGSLEGDTLLQLTFKQAEVSDVLKSLTVLDLDGGRVASVSYDSTRPLEQLLGDIALSIPDEQSLVGLLPQLKGARVAVESGTMRNEGLLLGIDRSERRSADGVVTIVLLSLLSDEGEIRSFDLHQLGKVELLDPGLRRDLDYYLRTHLSAKKKDARTFTFFAQGEGKRRVRLSYTLEAPVWKATYRLILGGKDHPPLIQGWAVVDNTQDEDWDEVHLSLIAGLPVSFMHDLYTPRYLRRPEIKVAETTGVLPPMLEEGIPAESVGAAPSLPAMCVMEPPSEARLLRAAPSAKTWGSSAPAQVRERKIGDLFEYTIEHPVTIRRNQSALVPIVLRSFEGRTVLYYNKANRAENPMRSVELKNTTGLTLEGGPVTVLEEGSYVGEAMLDTLRPDEERLVPYAVELAVQVLDNLNSHQEHVNRILLRNGILEIHFADVRTTTYTLNNKSKETSTVYLEHPRAAAYQLFDTPDPREITESFWRFRFALPAASVTQFVVKERSPILRRYGLSSELNPANLEMWIERRYVDARSQEQLRQALAVREKIATLERENRQLRDENRSIHEEQGRIRGNLGSLGDRSAEKELRDRYVRTLNNQEDRLAAIQRNTEENTAALTSLQQELTTLLEHLNYEVTF